MKIQGVSILKLPVFKKCPTSIGIEVIPTDTATTGIIIRSGSKLEQINQLLSNPKVIELANKIETVNPEVKEDKVTMRGTSTGTLEI